MSSISYQIVDLFENTIAEYTGSKYAVAVESCCAAIFLCCKYLQVREVQIPRYTYPGVASHIILAGGKIKFINQEWSGTYEIYPYNIIDAALRFKRGMFNMDDDLERDKYMCLSFHAKKLIPIGRGGMILTNDAKAYKWFKKARFDGRSTKPLNEDKINMLGWNMYMTPEQAAIGLRIFDLIKNKDLEDLEVCKQNYPNLALIDAYK